jgi:pilus assembly protein Flp/PilA
MNKLIESVKSASIFKSIKNGAVQFIRDEEGAQVVEYALIIAVVSIGLVLLLSKLLDDTGAFAGFVTRVTTCLSGSGTCK